MSTPESIGQANTQRPHLLSLLQTGDYGSDLVRIGDLNRDGAPDLLYVQTRNTFVPGVAGSFCQTREVSCLTAYTILGEVLWQWGEPCLSNGYNASDQPVQIYDWDNDGENEVLFIRQAAYAEMYPGDPPGFRSRAKRYEGTAELVVLNGSTGERKTSFPVPAPADENIVFADLTGRGRREDFVLKDPEGENVYGISREGEFLWHWHGGPWPIPAHNLAQGPQVFHDDPLCIAGHFPAVADVDGDGRDEVFIGFGLIDHDGRVLFRRDYENSHQDAVTVKQLEGGEWRLLFGNHGVHCLAVDGRELWHHPLVFNEAQHVVAGRFRTDSALQVAVIDRGTPRTDDGAPACLYLFDVETGKELWRRPQLPGGWGAACTDIAWTGRPGLQEMVVYKRGTAAPIAIYDGDGDILCEIPVPEEILAHVEDLAPYPHPRNYYCYRADVHGDSRHELLVTGRHGTAIYTNARALNIPMLYNGTLYHGM